jgi:uncharacterized protein
MADSRDQGKRYGMSNIRSHKLGDRSSGVEQDPRGHADCTGAYRRQRVYQGTETMEILHAVNSFFALSGFVVGALVGLTGVGGGSLMTLGAWPPGLEPGDTEGTRRLAERIEAYMIKAVREAASPANRSSPADGARRCRRSWSSRHRAGRFRLQSWPGRRKSTREAAIGSIPATIFTLTLLYEFGVRGGASPPLITIILACALILTAICVVSHRWLRMLTATRRSEPNPRRVAGLTITAGLFLGVVVPQGLVK